MHRTPTLVNLVHANTMQMWAHLKSMLQVTSCRTDPGYQKGERSGRYYPDGGHQIFNNTVTPYLNVPFVGCPSMFWVGVSYSCAGNATGPLSK